MARAIFPDKGSNPRRCIGMRILNHWTTRAPEISWNWLRPVLKLQHKTNSLFAQSCVLHRNKGCFWQLCPVNLLHTDVRLSLFTGAYDLTDLWYLGSILGCMVSSVPLGTFSGSLKLIFLFKKYLKQKLFHSSTYHPWLLKIRWDSKAHSPVTEIQDVLNKYLLLYTYYISRFGCLCFSVSFSLCIFTTLYILL